jgi:hypothetical protein
MIERNAPCPCGSGKKYKKCCGAGGGSAKAVASSAPSKASTAVAAQPVSESTGEQLQPAAARLQPESPAEPKPFLIKTGRGLESERTEAERKKHLRKRIQDHELRGTLVYNSGAFFKPPAK